MTSTNAKIVLILLVLSVVSCEDGDNPANEQSLLHANKNNTNREQQAKDNTTSGRFSSDQIRYDGSAGGPIDLTQAKAWVENFNKNAVPDEIRSHYFGRNVIDQILAQEGCTGVRIYYAFDDEGDKVLILSGVDGTGENMLPLSPTYRDGENILADMSLPCPSVCPTIDL